MPQSALSASEPMSDSISDAAAQPQALLIELLTEELPPKALPLLDQAFTRGLHDGLAQQQLLADGCTVTGFATPRRLAVLFSAVLQQAPARNYTEKLMPARVGLADGAMTPALVRRLQAKGLGHLSLSDLSIESDGKQDIVLYHGVATGALLADALQQALDHTIAHLPIPKVMQYQLADGQTVRFVRPAHSLLALWGKTVVNVEALGLAADRQTRGHRFLGQSHLRLPEAGQYDELLQTQGSVIPSFAERRARIQDQLQEQARTLGSTLGDDPEVGALLDEVTALVEYPAVYAGAFDADFLRIPSECLILTMRQNQKYFPLFDPESGRLTHRFLIVSNMAIPDPANIIQGNERVVRPRLADARFFFETDLKTPLADRVETLKTSVYHNKLGSQFDRVQRIQAIAAWLAGQLGAPVPLCERAAWLAKADLNTSMVGEFPELQGIMGAHYARHDGEDPRVALAIERQYRLRIDTPVADDTQVAAILFMAERAETLIGIWGIGLAPTGERDPFGLRRAALGLISAWEQLTAGGYLDVAKPDGLGLDNLLAMAATQFEARDLAPETPAQVKHYILERYRNQLAQTTDKRIVDAVIAVDPPIHQIPARVQACHHFATLPEADSLAAANKRVANILRRSPAAAGAVDPARLVEAAEHDLARTMDDVRPQVQHCLAQGDFTGGLKALAQCKDAVDGFFDHVMIMADDTALRDNRLALLRDLHTLMNQVADISRLAA